MRLSSRGVVLVAAAALCAAAAPPPGKHPPSRILVVKMKDLAYGPTALRAHVGDRVVWLNDDIFLHSATTPDFDVVVKPGASAGVRLLKAGTINYICRYHPGMKGQIVVSP